MLPHAIAVAPDVDDVAVVQQAINQRRRHDLVAENGAPLLEALVGRQHRGGVFVARIDQLEEQHRPVAAHRQIANLVDDQQRRMGQYPQTTRQLARCLGLLQRFDQPGQGAEVNPAPRLGGGNSQAYGNVISYRLSRLVMR